MYISIIIRNCFSAFNELKLNEVIICWELYGAMLMPYGVHHMLKICETLIRLAMLLCNSNGWCIFLFRKIIVFYDFQLNEHMENHYVLAFSVSLIV